jgi:putative transposase
MEYPSSKNRKSIRLKNYDYSNNGIYFVTISTQNKLNLFGFISNDTMFKNEIGNLVEETWLDVCNQKSYITGYNFVVMPNHIHLLMSINNPDTKAITLGNIIGSFKSITTNLVIKNVKEGSLARFDCKIWQRNYYEHIVRGEFDFNKISDYIDTNVFTWNKDILKNP